ncbi:MAG: DUF2752 domain-containing protein [Pyrinomonadaceae bacterium]
MNSEVAANPFADSTLRFFAGVGVAAMVVGAGVVWYFDPSRAGFMPACPLYTTTGFACPGCGMTRGLHALMHGDILTALDFNALIPLILIFLGYLFFSMLSVAVRGRGLAVGKWNLVLLWVVLGLLITFGILRNLPFYPFTILFP